MNDDERSALIRRKRGYRRLNTARFYMVTFDLQGSAGREALYAKFTTHLRALVGAANAHRFIKQCYFIKSDFVERDIRTEMQILLTERDSIMVTRLNTGASYRLRKLGAGAAARKFFADLEQSEGEL